LLPEGWVRVRVGVFWTFGPFFVYTDNMDQRTLKNIETLHPKARPWAKAHIEAVNSAGILPAGWSVRIVSGNRTWAEQDALYAQGRTKAGPVVTKARGGQSNHNFGIAWDIGIFDDKGAYLGESPYYKRIASVGKALGLEWGGDWTSIMDMPHYQVKTGLSVSQLRRLMLEKKELPIPAYQGAIVEVSDTPKTVQVFENAEKTSIPAFLLNGSTWVGLREFCNVFGGSIDRVDTTAGEAMFTITLDDHTLVVNGQITAGRGMVKFVDINRVLGWEFTFKNNMLTIHTDEPV
jgi:hypothetical protein